MTQKEALEALYNLYSANEYIADESHDYYKIVRQYIEGQGSVLYELLDKCFYVSSTSGGIDWRYNELFVLYESEPELSDKLLKFLDGHIPEGREGEEE